MRPSAGERMGAPAAAHGSSRLPPVVAFPARPDAHRDAAAAPRPWLRRWAGTGALVLLTALQPAIHPAGLASITLLLDGARAGDTVVAVGERGTILRSTDQARTWERAAAPTHATLTGISFADAHQGWVVGHDALILTTTDAGRTWTKSWQGGNLSDSFLDVLALDRAHVIAVGAYGLFITTADGGHTWTRRTIIRDDYHLNRVTRGPLGALYIAGEHGTLLRSVDAGGTWTPMPTDYEGSFYGVLPLGAHVLLAHGLRGRVYRSENDGSSWTAVASGQSELLATGAVLADGTVVLAGQARVFVASRDGGRSFSPLDVGIASGVAQILPLPDGALVALGEAGATRIESPRVAAAKPPGAAPAD